MNALALVIELGVTLMNGFGIMPVFSIFAGILVSIVVVRIVIQRFSPRK